MAGGEDDVRARLQRAALELFEARGYDRTTAAEIAARAGVTERTFFRKYPDKREVLFDGETILRTGLTEAIAAAPVGFGPLATLLRAFRSTLPLLEANRPYSKPRHEVISATPALHERELAKTAAVAEALAAALQARGVSELQAELAARIGMDLFAHATIAWLNDPEPDLDQRLTATWSELSVLVAEGNGSATSARNSSAIQRHPERKREP